MRVNMILQYPPNCYHLARGVAQVYLLYFTSFSLCFDGFRVGNHGVGISLTPLCSYQKPQMESQDNVSCLTHTNRTLTQVHIP